MFDLNDEITKINISGYLISRLYIAVVVVGETVYKLPSKSLKKLFIRLQRGDAFI